MIRCDRILWRTTVPIQSESSSDEDEPPPVPPKSGVGRFLQAFSIRSRRDSHASSSSTEVTPNPKDPTLSFSTETEGSSDHGHHFLSPPRSHGYNSHRYPHRRFSFSRSTDSLPLPTHQHPAVARSHTQVVIPVEPRPQPRKSSMPYGPTIRSASPPATTTKSFTVPAPHSAHVHRNPGDSNFSPSLSTEPVIPNLQQPHSPPRWLNFNFLPFISKDNSTTSPNPSQLPEVAEPEVIPPPPPPPRKGDVVCLSYDTLDDKAMRRLEGRSDHRPVIGSYAVYI